MRCRICGGKAGRFHGVPFDSFSDEYFGIYCTNCFTSTSNYDTEEQAFDAWNNGKVD